MSKNPLVIGVAGGSGSGKTTVVNYICDEFAADNILRIEHDSYYRELQHLPFEERVKQNFDHPASLETELMIRHIKALMEGYTVEVPVYDFEQHTRKEETITATPSEVILIDGILIFSEPDLLELMDVKIFVDTDDDVRLLRRLKRDIQDRGRSVDGVLAQYEKFVRPMHLEFVEPSKRYADVIIPRGGKNKVALEMVSALIRGQMSS
ncbi:MAG: uridine kinase [Balneola sp.]|jgi:uridine kinase|nr:uridine kinase [Balneola sp.]MBE80563.1 uridine kinase [Balneola sp.]|tara:strand:+ start:206 stop:829 length:624 start_codon:yes stop_codon:yes gene_type:complete